MYCSHCGKEISEGSSVCESCHKLIFVNTALTMPAEAEAKQEPKPVAPAKQEASKPKRRKRFPLGGLIKTVIFLAAIASVYLYWENILSYIMRTFSPPEEYLTYVELKAADNTIDDVSEAYGKLLYLIGGENQEQSNAVKTEVSVKIGDDLLQIMEAALAESGTDVEMDWISDVRVSVCTNSTDGLSQTDVGVGLGKTTIANVSVIMDAASGDMYLAIPELSDTYIYLNVGSTAAGETLDQALMAELVKLLPSEDKMNQVLNRWLKIAFDHVEDVQMTTETLEVDGLEQELTVLEYSITEKSLYTIAVEILKDMKEDKELLEVVYTVVECIPYVDNQLVDSIFDSFIEKLEGARDNADDQVLVRLTTYVDYTDHVVGRIIEAGTEESEIPEISYLTVWEEDEFAFEANLMNSAEIIGAGSREKKLVEGEFEMLVQGQSVLALEISDYDQKAARRGYINGTFTLAPSDELIARAMEKWERSDIITSLLQLTRVKLGVELVNSRDYTKCGVLINIADLDLLEISSSTEQKSPSDVEVPDETVEVYDLKAVWEWIRGMDLTAILENLEKAGMPEVMGDVIQNKLN